MASYKTQAARRISEQTHPVESPFASAAQDNSAGPCIQEQPSPSKPLVSSPSYSKNDPRIVSALQDIQRQRSTAQQQLPATHPLASSRLSGIPASVLSNLVTPSIITSTSPTSTQPLLRMPSIQAPVGPGSKTARRAPLFCPSTPSVCSLSQITTQQADAQALTRSRSSAAPSRRPSLFPVQAFDESWTSREHPGNAKGRVHDAMQDAVRHTSSATGKELPRMDSLAAVAVNFALSGPWASTELPECIPEYSVHPTSSEDHSQHDVKTPSKPPVKASTTGQTSAPKMLFTPAQTAHTRALKDSARMSHVLTSRTAISSPGYTEQAHHSSADTRWRRDDVTQVHGRANPQGRQTTYSTPRMGGRNFDSGFDPNVQRITKNITAAGSDWKGIMSVVCHEMDNMTANSIAAALHKLGSCCVQGNGSLRDVQSRQVLFKDSTFNTLKELARSHMPTFSARNVANFLWALAKLDHDPGHDILQATCHQAVRTVQEATTQNCSNILWALGTLNYMPGAVVVDSLLHRAVQLRSELEPQHISNIMWALAKLDYHPGEQVLDILASEACAKLKDFVAQALANTAWSCAHLGYLNTQLLAGIWYHVTRQGSPVRQQLIAQNWGNLAWSYATLNYLPAQDLMEQVCAGMRPIMMRSAAPQNITNVVWALAKLSSFSSQRSDNANTGGGAALPGGRPACVSLCPPGPATSAFVQAAMEQAAANIHSWQSQAISNLVWALATLGIDPLPRFLKSVCACMKAQLHRWSSQHTANTLWALATWGYKDEELLDTTADYMVRQHGRDGSGLAGFKPQHISNMLWAYGTLEHQHKDLMTRLLISAVLPRLHEFSSQELSNSCWAVARVAHYDCNFMDTLAEHILDCRVPQLLPQHISNISWAYGRVTHYHEGLMHSLADTATQRIQEFAAQHISNTLWAHALLAVEAPEFITACKAQVMARCRKPVAHPPKVQKQQSAAIPASTFNAQQVTNLLWGLSLMGSCDLDVWAALHSHLAWLGETAEKLPEEALTQVYQAYLLLLLTHGDENSRLIEMALPGVVQVAEQCWRKAVTGHTISGMHRDVSATLRVMGIQHVNEQLTRDSLFSVDIAIESKALPADLRQEQEATGGRATQIALEVDGPSHFAANSLTRPLGVTIARQQCLQARGWKVLSVTHGAWTAAKTQQGRVQLLRDILMQRSG